MEELVRSLRNLGLAPPTGEQIVSLVDADPRVEQRLARELSVPPQLDSHLGGDAVLDTVLMSGATEAMLQSYNRKLQSEIASQKKQQDALASPKRIKRVPLKGLLAAQDAELRRRRQELQEGTTPQGLYVPRQFFDTDSTYCSDKDYKTLRPLEMDELEVPKRYVDRSLVVKVISRPSLYFGCTFVGMLHCGAALPITVCYFTARLTMTEDELAARLPIGTTLLIKEPFVSTNHAGIGGPITGGKNAVGIRVDTPSDVVVIDNEIDWPELPVPVEKSDRITVWRQEGPLCRAVRKGLQLPSYVSWGSTQQALLEFLEDERPGAAWRELKAAELYDIVPSSESAEWNSRVLVRLCAFKDAAGLACKHQKEHQAAANVAVDGLSTEDVVRIFNTTLTDATPRFDVADYIGPVTVADIPNAGRGLVLTRDVAEGELLLVCRAMVSSYSSDDGCKGMPLLRVNPDSGVTSTTTQVLAATKCIHAILDRPELALPFLGLTAGPNEPLSVEAQQEYPLSWSYECDAKKSIFADTDRPVSARYVNGVLRFNAFGPAAVPGAQRSDDEMSRSTMPHPLPAILNHACLPNVSSVFFGDIVTTRALHPMTKGTQIMHQYVPGVLPYNTRQRMLSKHGFVCECGLCTMDVMDGAENCRKREELLATVLPPLVDRSRALLSGGAEDMQRELASNLGELANELNATYGESRGNLRPDLVDVLYREALHVQTYDVPGAIALVKASLCAAGATPGDGTLDRLPDVHFDASIRAMLMLAQLEDNLKWVDAACYTHDCMIGGGLESNQ
ncbi:hypothetical protein MCUN1_003179 [Malassezia cuniculi]|uniref:SET domain-containing protein n=1 Tax=Malassezia cuniculi TaxID=948313 RepID=A0AAF0J7P6_9BASI|nr:hypothetical protein MCUN1_003179 [Malassezia cuniculi]